MKWHLPALLAARKLLQVCCQQILVIVEQRESNNCRRAGPGFHQGHISCRVTLWTLWIALKCQQCPLEVLFTFWKLLGGTWPHNETHWWPGAGQCSGSPCLLSKEASFAMGRLWSGKDWQSGCSFIPDHYTCAEKICWPTVITWQWVIEIRSNDYVCMQTRVLLKNLWTAQWCKMRSKLLLLKYSLGNNNCFFFALGKTSFAEVPR